MRGGVLTIVACLALLVAGCGSDSSSTSAGAEAGASPAKEESTQAEAPSSSEAEAATKPVVKVPSGPPPKKLEVKDLKTGTGRSAKAGAEVTVQYVGVGYKTKEQFDASWDRGEPFPFVLGSNSVIPGWEQGVEGMKVGGRRELTIPPNLAYGPAGAPPSIGPNETLIFVIDLVAVS